MAKGRRGEYVVLPRIEQVFSKSLAKTCQLKVHGHISAVFEALYRMSQNMQFC